MGFNRRKMEDERRRAGGDIQWVVILFRCCFSKCLVCSFDGLFRGRRALGHEVIERGIQLGAAAIRRAFASASGHLA
jgi:hypothetical protein